MNSVTLNAVLCAVEPMKYSLAGIPLLNCRLRYAGEVQDGDAVRKLKFEVSAKAVGDAAEKLASEALETPVLVHGYLAPASARSTKLLVYITEYDKGV